MLRRNSAWQLWWFAATVLVSAFLVFQVQPVISKMVLPWFGGSPAVWTTCMLFFQAILFAGYAYAHLLTQLLSPRWQGAVHLVLMTTALLTLPIAPDESWKPAGTSHPTLSILLLLLANVGLPYFILSATGPLIQAWFRHVVSGTSPYRLYALSNVGSLAALVSYPFLVEPAMTTEWQSRFWSWGYCLFVLLCGYVAAALLGMGQRAAEVSAEPRREAELSAAPSWRHRLAWLLLPAFASIMLLATTNHVCQDVAVIPFLWVAPLSLYLLTFIVCFDREQWYSRTWFGTGAVLSIIALSLSIRFEWNWALPYELASYFSAMFCVCMVCHGELVRSKPHPRYLTGFYLMSSAGGALGGIAVAVICPQVFSMHLEMNLSVLAGTCLCLGLLLLDARDGWLGDSLPRRCISVLTYLAVLLFVGLVQLDAVKNKSLASVRNFYGVLHVLDNEKLQGTTLVHGRIIHGFQFHNPLLRQMPTTYYSQESGAGVALRRFRAGQPLRVGIVGLGSGTLAAYGRSGDTYRFYEINPAVVDVAHRYFHFLDDCKARVEVALGDARLSLERESPQAYDVLVLDAFSGDAIPTHLLTREAFELYLRHLKPDGVIALHISNRQLRLDPVVLRLAENFDLTCVQVNNRHDNRRSVFAAKWMLLTANRDFLADQDVQRVAAYPIRKPDDRYRLWTDQYSNLFQILNVF